MAVKNLLVRGGADFSGMQKEMAKAQKSLSNFQSNVGGTMKKIGAILGGLAIGKLIKDSTQMAMGVESSIGNINRNMAENAKAFQNWVNTQAKGYGIAKADAYKYGGTFSNLLASFTGSTGETAKKTEELMKAAAIISSKTGRSYEDTAERIRSGMLGSTEAIEDLGVYTNVAMIESTNAFKQFANGKSWAQLDFQTQQQIRLAAILEQTYARYGNELANTTQTSHAQFIASLKNIQLAIGQAFMPIYSAVLPALTALANAIGTVFNYIAQFTTALFGKPADTQKQAQATAQQAKATTGLGNATEKAGKKAKKAGKEAKGAVASFDEINSLSKSSGGGAEDTGAGGVGAGAGAMSMPPMDIGGFANSTIEVSDKVKAMADKVKETLTDLANFFQKNKDVIVSSIAGIVAAFASFQIISNWSSIIKGITIVFQALGAAIGGISWPIVAVAALIGLLVGNLIYLWRTNEDFRNSVLEVWQQIKDFISKIVTDIGTIATELWQKYGATLVQNLKDFMKSIQDIIVNVWENFIKPIIKNALEMLQWLWDKHLKDLVKEVGDFVLNLVNSALEIWNKFISPLVNWLVKILGPIFADIINGIVNTWGDKVAMFIDIAKGIFKVLGGIIDFIMGVFTGDWKKAWGGIMKILEGIWDGAVGIVKYPLNLIIDAINTVINGLSRIKFDVPDWVPSWAGGGKSFGINIKPIQKLAKGGIVDRPTTALIGEAGTEAVVPLENNTGGLDLLAEKLTERIGGDNSKQPILLTIQMGSTRFFRGIIDGINQTNREAGQNLIII